MSIAISWTMITVFILLVSITALVVNIYLWSIASINLDTPFRQMVYMEAYLPWISRRVLTPIVIISACVYELLTGNISQGLVFAVNGN